MFCLSISNFLTMKPRNYLLLQILSAMFIFILMACINSSPPPASAKVGTKADSATLPDTSAAPQTIKIGTFNIQNFGLTKVGKPDVVKELVSIIRKYDVIAVQEISDKTNKTAFRFLDSLNRNQAVPYRLLLSPRTGRQAANVTDQEQYAFYYNTSTIKDLGQSLLYNDSAHDYFCREPFLAHFKVLNGNFSFVLCTIHTKPAAAPEEIKSLDNVVKWAKVKFGGEDDFIVLGDFNASCSYATPAQLDGFDIRKADYQWIIADTVKTNLSSKTCTYDRIVMTKSATSPDYTGEWGVDRCFASKTISDHWPVWAAFYTTRDVH